MLPAPPTTSPTATGGPDAWYADYDVDFADGVCKNTMPAPNGRTIYDTQLDCCKGEYGTQTSGACIADLPAPPTVSPTATGGVDAYYKAPNVDYAAGYCINTLPTPNGVVVYDTELECCQGEYASQSTGVCLSMLPAPPTVSPTQTGGVDAYYKAPNVDYAAGYCINTLPAPNGAVIYDTELECCQREYASQSTGVCLSMLPAPPTVSPTQTGGPDAWYADFDAGWTNGVCINTMPAPNGRTIYDSQLECCKGAYPGQESGACIADLPAPPTVSPTATGGPDAWYANRDVDWADGVCINTAPVPNGRVVYDTQLECCQGEYGSQNSGACLADLPSPPTVSPTATGGPNVWYADRDADWTQGTCINTAPVPNGRVTYDSELECCKGEYASQSSGACLAALPAAPTASPVGASTAEFFPIWSGWESGHCDNDPTLATSGNTYRYATQVECCEA
jgi:hypothetical protein